MPIYGDLVELLIGDDGGNGYAHASLRTWLDRGLLTWGGALTAPNGETLDRWVSQAKVSGARAQIRMQDGRIGIVVLEGRHASFLCTAVKMRGSGPVPF